MLMDRYRYFGDAEGLRRPPDGGLLQEAVPDGVRNAVATWLDANLSVEACSRA